MAEESAFYITSVAHGMVLARSPNGQPSGVVAQNRGDQDAPQKWLVETGSESNIIALRCASTNDYLHANGGGNWATVGTGEKQWWKLDVDNVTAPGACRLSPVDYPKVFLNHFQGIRVAKGQSMKVHMWQWEQPNQFCLTWYFFPADGSFGPNGGASGGASSAASAKMEALEQEKKEADAKLKELQASKKEYDAKLATLEDGKKGSAATIKELQDKLARQARELEEQKAKLKQNVDGQNAAEAQRAQDKAAKLASKTQKKEEKTAKKASKQEDKALKKQQASRLPPSPPASPPQEKVALPATNGVAKEVKDGCKHVVLPPPRKIRRKVVGIVYAQ